MASVTPINQRVAEQREALLSAEKSVLGGMLLREQLIGEVQLDSGDFFSPKHQIIHVAMRALHRRGEPVDLTTVCDELAKYGHLQAVGDMSYLADLALHVPTPENVRHYAERVTKAAQMRKIAMAAAELAEQAGDAAADPDALLADMLERVSSLTEHRKTAATGPRWNVPLPTFMGDAEPDDDDREDWSIRDIVPRGEPMLWASPPKSGKTWNALDLLISLALGRSWLGTFENCHGAPVKAMGIFLEDGQRRLRKRVWEVCRTKGVSPRDERIAANLTLSRTPFSLPDRDDERRITAEIIASGAEVVIVDNLTRVMVGDPNNTRDASEFTKAWGRIGNATGAAIVFLHHTKKAQEGGPMADGDPFNTIRGSGDFSAFARHMIVAKPLQLEGRTMSEVFLRGNLDLHRESFALAFTREQVMGKWQAVVSDAGDAKSVKADAREAVKAKREELKKAELAKVIEHRRAVALDIVRRLGAVNGGALSAALEVSRRTADSVLMGLEQSQVLRRAGQLGYVFFDADEVRS